MRVLLISANREQINMRTWPLGASCVATFLKRHGHTVDLLDLMQHEQIRAPLENAVSRLNPELIGISIRNIDDQSMLHTTVFLDDVKDLINHIRTLTPAVLVLGGAGFSIFPEPLMDFLQADAGIRSDGEQSLLQLIEHLGHGERIDEIPGLCLPNESCNPQQFPKDLNAFSLPDREFLPNSDLGEDETFWLPVQTRRGCPLKCSYCSTPAIEGCTLRSRSPESVTEWISMCVKQGFRRFYFVDNTFNIPAEYATKLCSVIINAELDIAWRSIIYPLHITDDLAEIMANSGCREVSLGFESGADTVLAGFNKRFSPKEVSQAARTLGNQGIRRMGFLMMGGPGETIETARTSLEFADSLDLEMMKVSVGIRIYPNTPLADRAVSDGIISENDDLLQPKFYVAPRLDDALSEMVETWINARSNWIR